MRRMLFLLVPVFLLSACASAAEAASPTEVPSPLPVVSTSSGVAVGSVGSQPATAVATAIPEKKAEITPIPHPGAGTGVYGTVTMGPACPVETPDNPCPDAPYQATLTILNLVGEVVTQTTTGTDGYFSLALAPGDYILHPERPGNRPMPSAPDQPFSVIDGQFVLVKVVYDSGIR